MVKKRTRRTVSRINPQARTKGFRQRVPLSDVQKAKIRTTTRRKNTKRKSNIASNVKNEIIDGTGY